MRSMRKSRLRYWFGLLIVPPSLWALMVALSPMGWARDRVAMALEQTTGAPVRLGALRLGLLGGVKLHDLEVGPERDDGAGPWLLARRVAIDVNLGQLLSGRIEPTRCRAKGVELRVWRRADGTLECGGLFEDRGPDPGGTEHVDHQRPDPTVAFELAGARLLIVDEPTGTRLDLTEATASGTWSEEAIDLDHLGGALNGGRLELAARLERAAPSHPPRQELALRLQSVELEAGLGALAYFVPAVVHARRTLDGRLDMALSLRSSGSDGEEIARKLLGEGSVRLEDVSLDGSPMLSAVAEGFRVPARGKFGSLRGNFVVADRRITTRNLSAELGPVPIAMAGWTDFDGRMDYLLRLDELTARVSGLADRLPEEVRGTLTELQATVGRAAQLRIQGSEEGLVLSADGVRLDEWVRRAGDPRSPEFDRLREIGRNIRDRERLRR